MDILHDNSFRSWVKIGNTCADIIPPYVREYIPLDDEKASKLANADFADPARRLFPLVDEPSTWLSAAYFTKNAEELPYKQPEHEYVLIQIKQAAYIFGIEKDVEQIIDALSEQTEKVAAEDDNSNYGWVIVHGTTGEVLDRLYPMFDANGVKRAMDYFDAYRDRYPIGIRRTIARNILNKAAQYIVEPTPTVKRESGCGIPRKDVLMEELLERAHLTKDAELSIALANINELIAGIPDREIGDNLDKIAEVVDAFDRANGLVKYYGKQLLMPADFIFDVDLKTAEAALEDSVELDKYVFSVTKLAQVSPAVFGNVLGEEFVTRVTDEGGKIVVSKLADELYSLPKPDRSALENALAA